MSIWTIQPNVLPSYTHKHPTKYFAYPKLAAKNMKTFKIEWIILIL